MASIDVDFIVEELKRRGFESYDPDQLHKYIEWGWQRIARLADWQWEEQIATILQQAGDPTILLSSDMADVQNLRDIIKLVDVTTDQETLLTPISRDEWASKWLIVDLNSEAVRGVPQEYFYQWQSSIYLLPPPATAHAYKLYYYQYVTAESGIDLYPPEFEELLLIAAEMICQRRARMLDVARDLEAQLGEGIAEMLNEQAMKNPDLQERVDAPWSRVR